MKNMISQLGEDIKAAMKSGDKFRTNVLRMVLSEIKYDQVAGKTQKELSDVEQVAVVARYHKRLKKSMSDFQGSPKLVELEQELAIVEEYLPKQASREEIEAAVKAILAGSAEAQFGVVMKEVMTRLGGNADGKVVSEVVRGLIK